MWKSLYSCMFVTEQTRAHSCGALVYDPTINAGRNRSLFTIFQPWERLEHLSSEPPLP